MMKGNLFRRQLRRQLSLILVVFTLFLMFPGYWGGITIAAAQESDIDINSYDSLGLRGTFCYDKAFEVLAIVNAERAKVGLRPLRMDAELLDAAMVRAAETALLFSHTRPNGEACFSISGSMFGENIAYGHNNAAGTMEQWMNSPGHKYNILNGWSNTPSEYKNPMRYTTIGIGCFEYAGRCYWSQAFGIANLSSDCARPRNDMMDVMIAMPRNNFILDGGNRITYTFDPLVWIQDEHNSFFYAIGDEPILVNVGEGTTLGLGMNGVVFIPESVRWKIGDASVAKMDGINVIGVKPGITKLTAMSSAGTERATANVKVVDFKRVSGKDRYLTSIAAADYLLEQRKESGKLSKFDTVVIAFGGNFADALSGTYLAGITDAPILLVNKTYEEQVVSYIKSNLRSGGKAYILGGNLAVSKSVEDKLGSSGFAVKRLAGQDRYGTNLAILEECAAISGLSSGSGSGSAISNNHYMICSGTSFADSLSAASVGYPIMLVGKSLTSAQREHLLKQQSLTVSKFAADIIGGTFAVNSSVEGELGNYTAAIRRIGGKDRFETSELVAKNYFSNPDSAVLVYSQNFPDGLSGGPVGVALNAPILLVNNKNYSRAESFCKLNRIRKVVAVGGQVIIPDEVGIACVAW